MGHAQTIDQGLFPPPEVRIEYVFSESDEPILKDQAMMKKDLTETIQKMHQAYQHKSASIERDEQLVIDLLKSFNPSVSR